MQKEGADLACRGAEGGRGDTWAPLEGPGEGEEVRRRQRSRQEGRSTHAGQEARSSVLRATRGPGPEGNAHRRRSRGESRAREGSPESRSWDFVLQATGSHGRADSDTPQSSVGLAWRSRGRQEAAAEEKEDRGPVGG